MINPIISQTKNRNQVSTGRLYHQDHATQNDRIGTTGTQGVRKVRRRSGCFDRSTSTPSDTSTKANSVPMWKGPPGTDIENPADSHEKARHQGAHMRRPIRLWTLENARGSRRRRDIANQTRA